MTETTAVTFTGHDAVKEALNSRLLARSTDYERFERGGILDGALVSLHGKEHSARRRVESPFFRREHLLVFERKTLPTIIDAMLPKLLAAKCDDIVQIAGVLSILISKRIAGIDVSDDHLTAAVRLVAFDAVFNAAASIEDSTLPPEQVKRQFRDALAEFRTEFFDESLAARSAAVGLAEDPRPSDILSALVQHREELDLDDETIARETAFYLESGSHTSAHTVTATLHYIFDGGFGAGELADDLLRVQRFTHEAIRLCPSRRWSQRRVVAEGVIANQAVRPPAVVDIDIWSGNTDESVYGANPLSFDPDRAVREDAPRYGLGFGGGIHSCIGKVLAIGLNIPDRPVDLDQHIFGMVAVIVQALLQIGIRPRHDLRSVAEPNKLLRRSWQSYPVAFG